MPVEFSTPVGRVVWGHPAHAKQRMDDNNQPVIRANGEKAMQWSFGVAFTKADFQQHIWPYLAQEAATAYPNGAPQSFSWKYVDGDGVDSKGLPFNQREGYAGCYILAISTELQAPPIYKFNGTKYDQLPGEAIKTGDYVSVGIDARVNVPTDPKKKSGLYINPKAVELVGYGTPIVSQGQADPNALFGGRQHQLPAGASATPIGGAGAVGMPGMGQQQPQPGMMQPAMGQPVMQPTMAAQPATQPGMMQPQMQPQMQPAMVQPVMQPQPGMMPPPAHDFVQPGMQQPAMGQPMMQPQMQPGMPAAGGMPGFPPPR
jgi:hypothetical protein